MPIDPALMHEDDIDKVYDAILAEAKQAHEETGLPVRMLFYTIAAAYVSARFNAVVPRFEPTPKEED
jgi:hypothetical protein